jgi:hypothetical protein
MSLASIKDELDAEIGKAEAAAARAASQRKEAQSVLRDTLAIGRDTEARAAQRKMHELEDEAAFQEAKVLSLKARRAEAATKEAADEKAAKWAAIKALIGQRAALAATIDKSIDALGKGYAALAKLDADALDALRGITGRQNVAFRDQVVDDRMAGAVYSLCAAGLTFVHPAGKEARTAGNLLSDRVERSNAFILSEKGN